MLTLVAIGAFLTTLLGGFFAIKFQDKLHLILGFSAGTIVGVALFELIPESLNIAKPFWSDSTVMLIIALGFVIYMILDRLFFAKCNEEDNHHHRGRFGAGSFSFHSFLDGVAIGISFNVSSIVGVVVATTVLIHNFSDGINTASMIIRHGGNKKEALKWVVLDALAPSLGIISTLFFTIPEKIIPIILSVFAGFFLYIGASDLLPESHHNHPTKWTTFATILGMTIIYIVVLFAGI